MTRLNNPSFETAQNESLQELTASQTLADTKDDRRKKLKQFERPELKALARNQLNELEAMEKQMMSNKDAIADAQRAFEADIKALKIIETEFANLNDNFKGFMGFLSS